MLAVSGTKRMRTPLERTSNCPRHREGSGVCPAVHATARARAPTRGAYSLSMRQRRSTRELGFVVVVAALFCAALLGSPPGLDAGGSEVSLKTSGGRSITALVFGGGLRPSFVRLRPSGRVLHADLSAGDLHV